MYIDSNSPVKIASKDKGADVQQRFRYQHSYVTLIAVQMCRQNSAYKEIFCEHHEDALVVDMDKKFVGIQIKTRENVQPLFFV